MTLLQNNCSQLSRRLLWPRLPTAAAALLEIQGHVVWHEMREAFPGVYIAVVNVRSVLKESIIPDVTAMRLQISPVVASGRNLELGPDSSAAQEVDDTVSCARNHHYRGRHHHQANF